MPYSSEFTTLDGASEHRPTDSRLWNNRDITALALRAQFFRSNAVCRLLIRRPPGIRRSNSQSRVTLNDQKRKILLKEFGDSTVPLDKLAKSVPHGTKNVELAECALQERSFVE